jgi:hypothetical protein
VKKLTLKKIILLLFISTVFTLAVFLGLNNKNNFNSINNENDKRQSIILSVYKFYSIGFSVENRPINITEIGYGNDIGIVLIGCIHGDESNTGELVNMLKEKYLAAPELIPDNFRMYFLPEYNIDGKLNESRYNSNNVDLNRNFPVENWESDAYTDGCIQTASGGTAPGSEPETAALIQWIINNVKKTVKHIVVISFHNQYSPTGAVQPGYIEYETPGDKSNPLVQFQAVA